MTDTENLTSDPRMARELELEEMMLDTGMSAYHRRNEAARDRGEAYAAGASRKLTAMTIEPLSRAIQAALDDAASGRPGRRHVALKYLRGISTDLAAFLTVSGVIAHAATLKRLQKTAVVIASRIEDEARITAFERDNPGLVRAVFEKLSKQTPNRRWHRTVVVHLLNQRGDSWVPWSEVDKLQVGTRLIDLLIEATGMAEIHRIGAGKTEVVSVRLTAAAQAWIRDTDAHRATLAPRFMPMVVPPRPWTRPVGGGYVSATVGGLRIAKARADVVKAMEGASMVKVYRALNAVQETPWRVNKRVLDVLRTLWRQGGGVAKLPASEDAPLPSKPLDIDSNPEALAQWKLEAAQVYSANAKLASKRISISQVISVADIYADEPEIYFPHQLDFRGRLYAVPMFLNPQGADCAKGLLEFAAGTPILDGVAAGWLAIHGANLWGYDKVGLEERIAWVEERADLIRRTAEDPLADLWWAGADKPWCFLAWLLEWAGFLTEGLGFVSRQAVALDGSCNGLQHYSAMLRDPVGGAAVNLIPAPAPKDIYGEVAKVVMRRLDQEAASGLDRNDNPAHYALRWFDFGIDRKMTKRSVMILPYGGTRASCTDYTGQAYQDAVAAGREDPFTSEERRGAVLYLSAVVWESIGEVVVAARQAMDWLRALARAMTAAGKPVTWTTPVGFPVTQDYRDVNRRRVETRFQGSMIKLTLLEDTDVLDRYRQTNGLPPNFVHSHDAAALCETVDLALDNGISTFAVVHDSFGTNAADTEMLSQCIRHAFVDMYTAHDPLAAIETSVRAALPPEARDKLPPRPASSTLDLQLVLESDFFFA